MVHFVILNERSFRKGAPDSERGQRHLSFPVSLDLGNH